MRALICGAGISGLTLAWHLERAGWEVELVERAPAFRESGYLIDFFGPGHQVAERMGLLPRLLDVRYPVSAVDYVDGAGRTTSRLTMPPDMFQVISLLRGDLARVIQEQVRSPIRYGTSVASAERSGTMADVRLTDGTRRTVDLLVGADGAHSRVRELVFGPEHRFLRYLDHQVSAYILRDEELSRRIGARYRMLTVPGRMAGGYALRDGRLALLFLRHETDPAIPADPAAALRRHFGDLGWILPEVLPRCPPPPELYHDQVTQIEMARWSEGRVVLLGDACQAVSLFAGHGASLGMAAAWVLADELAHGEVAGALIRYEERMRPAVEEVQRAGRRFVKWMAPATRRHIVARDLMIRLAGLPGLGRLFVNSLSPGGHRLITSRADHLDDHLDDARDRA